jgi:pyrimidine-nucleoside phosphorylase
MVGSIARYLGAGRMNDVNEIDNTAGIVLEKKMGDEVTVGETIAYIHANDEEKANGAIKNLSDAFLYSKKPIYVKSRVLEVYGI